MIADKSSMLNPSFAKRNGNTCSLEVRMTFICDQRERQMITVSTDNELTNLVSLLGEVGEAL